MKNYSAESLSVPLTTTLRAGRANDSVARSAHLLSCAEARVPAILRDLKPRFLEGLTPPELKSVLAAAEHRRLPANRVITHQDDPAEHLFLLLTGRARYFFVTEKGQKVVLLWIPPGEIFGVATFLSPPSGYITNTETGRNSSMLVWDRATIRGLAARHPRLLENALYLAIYTMIAYRAKHRALICATARERFGHVLVTLATGIGHKGCGGR